MCVYWLVCVCVYDRGNPQATVCVCVQMVGFVSSVRSAATEAFERTGTGEVAAIIPQFDPEVKSSNIACVARFPL